MIQARELANLLNRQGRRYPLPPAGPERNTFVQELLTKLARGDVDLNPAALKEQPPRLVWQPKLVVVRAYRKDFRDLRQFVHCPWLGDSSLRRILPEFKTSVSFVVRMRGTDTTITALTRAFERKLGKEPAERLAKSFVGLPPEVGAQPLSFPEYPGATRPRVFCYDWEVPVELWRSHGRVRKLTDEHQRDREHYFLERPN